MIRDVRQEDAAEICGIYNYYLENTVITFEENSVSPVDMAERIRSISLLHPWIVLEEEGRILGYAYASLWRVRSAYRFSSELTIYLHREFRKRGEGARLYGELIERLKKAGKHSLYGVIALPNDASVSLHEKMGFFVKVVTALGLQ